MIKRIIVLLGIVFLTSCAASGPKFQEKTITNATNAIIYVYRPSKTVNCCVAPKVYLNKVPTADLKNGGYIAVEVPAGKHEVTVGDGSYGFTPEKLMLSLNSGESVYLKWVIGGLTQFDIMAVGNVAVGTSAREYFLLQFPKEKAIIEISELKLSQ